ncbi:MAG: alpha/beta hydrolase [Anaerolineae bacterium]|nr:alpha/beta hydrolase [Anaerolineae bacterium]
MNIVLIIMVLIVGLLVIGALYQAAAVQRDHKRFPPPGKFAEVDGVRLHYVEMGQDKPGPTVILESGMASFSSNWAWVLEQLAETTHVVAYDRAGLGWSDPGTTPRDAAKSARQLHALLQAASIPAPYVLAGHSYGGLVIRMFADLYPAEVVGLALVDSSHPDQWASIPASKGGQTIATVNRVSALLCRFGIMRLFRLEKSFIEGLPSQQYEEMRAYLARPEPWIVGAEGLTAWRDLSRDQVNAAKNLGNLPLMVLSVTEQDMYADVLTRLQSELPALSSNSKHITIQGATHYTMVSKQEYAQQVSDAILAVVDSARTKQPLTQV